VKGTDEHLITTPLYTHTLSLSLPHTHTAHTFAGMKLGVNVSDREVDEYDSERVSFDSPFCRSANEDVEEEGDLGVEPAPPLLFADPAGANAEAAGGVGVSSEIARGFCRVVAAVCV
jgi:hypothetical protein